MDFDNNVRVRFAPSPTGYLHIGGLRTALFNYLFAKHNSGKFILRIEDTDRARLIEGAVENMIKTLDLMELHYDEGPDVGGDFGPYFQSERLEIYRNHIKQLLENDSAYYCFCSQERLEEIRKVQKLKGLQTQYDRHCRNLSQQEVEKKLDEKIPHVVRLKVPLDTEVVFQDIIRGTIKIDTNLIDDQVLLKSDGFPTYHLANVIDDHFMEISHIIRGEEWLTSVPKHILLYNAFGWDIPYLAHVPLILNPNKTKLSKRQGDVATEDFINKGYLPEALLNFIALLGWNPGEGETKEIFSLDEMIKMFSLEKISSSGAIFNLEKLDWMNNQYMQIKCKTHDSLIELDEKVRHFMQNDYLNLSELTTGVTYSVVKSSNTLLDAAKKAEEEYPISLNLTREQKQYLLTEDNLKLIRLMLKKLNNVDEKMELIKLIEVCRNIIKELQKETGLKGKSFFHPLRIVVSGREQGPELAEYISGRMKLIGKEKFLNEIKMNITL